IKYAAGSTLITNQEVAVIFEAPARDESSEVSAELVDFQAGNIAAQIFGVGSNVTDATRVSGSGKIRTPGGLLLPFCVNRLNQPTLRVFRYHLKDFSQITVPD